MIDAVAQSRLQELFRRENRTLMQYAREASPWVGESDRGRAERIAELARTEHAELETLARFLEKQHVPLPYLGAYPMAFTSYNFITIKSLLPKLVEDVRRSIVALEADRDALNGAVHAAIEPILELKRKHLVELEQL